MAWEAAQLAMQRLRRGRHAEVAPHLRAPAPGLRALLSRTVLVSALGYFVETYDLLLFTVVRVPSLRSLGVPEAQMLDVGVLLLNLQMAGLLTGGLLWGMLGDRRGRVATLFGSIALYSVATLANAFVPDVTSYAALRFVAGVGLAGELGTAVTLVSETLPKDLRAYGTTLVGVIGLHGAVFAAVVGGILQWQHAFLLGGAMGLALLVTRYKMAESGLFDKVLHRGAARGDLRVLFRSRARASRYLAAIIMGAPTWFVVAIVVTFAPEVGAAIGVAGPVTSASATIAVELGLMAGNASCAVLSQRLRTRWWTILGFVALVPLATMALLYGGRGVDPLTFYALVGLLGVVAGYRVLFLTMAGENFGTNVRNTVVATAANFSRFSVVPLTLGFTALIPLLGIARSVVAVGAVCVVLAMVAFRGMDETYGRDLDFVEA